MRINRLLRRALHNPLALLHASPTLMPMNRKKEMENADLIALNVPVPALNAGVSLILKSVSITMKGILRPLM